MFWKVLHFHWANVILAACFTLRGYGTHIDLLWFLSLVGRICTLMQEYFLWPLLRGTLGVPNTAITYEKLVNTEIPCRKWTKYRYRIIIGDAYLTLYPSRVFFISSIYTPEINLREKWEDFELIGTKIETPGHWMSYQFYHKVTVRNCVFICR